MQLICQSRIVICDCSILVYESICRLTVICLEFSAMFDLVETLPTPLCIEMCFLLVVIGTMLEIVLCTRGWWFSLLLCMGFLGFGCCFYKFKDKFFYHLLSYEFATHKIHIFHVSDSFLMWRCLNAEILSNQNKLKEYRLPSNWFQTENHQDE